MDRMSTKGQMIDQIDLRAVPHSGFDRSNHNYFTGRLGGLIPKRLDEVYPGDRIKGSPEVVTNFEPLVAPLMGTMVQKQEQFFIPYIQVWRHAYKFFTGKNGFSQDMPTITPADLFNIHSEEWFSDFILAFANETMQDLNHIYNHPWDADINGLIFLPTSLNAVCDAIDSKFELVFGPRKMLDLVQPMVQNIRNYMKDAYIKDASVFAGGMPTRDFESIHELSECDYYTLRLYAPYVYFSSRVDFQMFIINFVRKILAPFISRAYMYIFGPSSLLDYIGWPIDTKVPHFAFGNPETLKVDRYSDDDFAVDVLLNGYLFTDEQFSVAEVISNLESFHFSHVPLNFLPFKGYYLVWYWNYRDQLLETDILDPEDDEFLGTPITHNVVLYCTILRQRCWFKDTYTTALTNTGDGNLLVPISQYSKEGSPGANIRYYNAADQLINTDDVNSAITAGATVMSYTVDNITYKIPMNYLSGAGGSTSTLDGKNFISLDIFDRIKRLRSVVQKRLILGYEVDDVVYSSFMVRMTNVRLHIPEILGRGRDTVLISTVVNNTTTPEQIAGDKTATAWCHGKSSEINYFSEEWGFYLDIFSVMPIQSYAGGMQRLYLKKSPFDFMWPEFATMGMDAIYNCELAALGTRLSDNAALQVFGYQGRYYDLKSRHDEEHGRLLTDLNYLTFSREWNSENPPKLNYIFVHCWPRLDGFVMQDPMEDVFRCDCYTAQGWERRLPVPSEIVGH